MRCSQLARHFAARTDSGTRDCLQVFVPGVGLGRVAQNIGLVRVFTIDLRGIHVHVGRGLGPNFARVGFSF